jgi:hypothetical protein
MVQISCALTLTFWFLAISAQARGIESFALDTPSASTSDRAYRFLSTGPAPNDFFANALKVPAQPSWVHTTSNDSASMEQFEPALAHGGEPNAQASIWYSWSVRERSELLIDTAGSTFAAAIGVYRGTSLQTLVPVAGASSLRQGRDAWVRFTAEPNVSYKIAIAGIPPEALGSARVRFEIDGQPDLAVPMIEVTRPLSGATVREARVRIEGTAFDPQPNGSGLREVQYTLSAEGDAIVRNAQGTSNFTATVDLANGVNIITLWAFDHADNRSVDRRIAILLNPVLSTNDLFIDRIVLEPTATSRSDISSGATREVREPAHAGNPGGSSIWYEFGSAEPGVLLVSTLGSTFDTLLGVYVSTNSGFPTVTNLTEIASNDDVVGGSGYSEAAVTVQPGRKYFVAVDGFDGQAGLVQLNYQFRPGPVYELAILPSVGAGTVSPRGGPYPENASVSISARPAAGYLFDYFETPSGPIRENPLALVMDRNVSLRAFFRVRTFAEDFEDGLSFPFRGNWSIQTDPTNRVNHIFASSGNRQDRTTNIVTLTVRVADGIGGFDYAVSTETNRDRLEFSVVYIEDEKESNRTPLGAWSGEVRGRHEFALRSGMARLEWRFSKDGAISDGADRVFIDNLDLPFSAGKSVLTRTGETVRVRLFDLGAQSIRVESSADLQSWTPARTLAPDSAGEAVFQEAATGTARFYRFIGIPFQNAPPP